ncbi:hypothetical protein PHYPSEUDO_010369 [Phytophthora pseudosyringae]|uniref:Uncharacterized protein n=1 Tax=Phytophthora pseudosyringae TaxID=221518 RepID=A0A8T1WB40_9STRA|nr:hypothetical protein PHYPSEUDO_010369 [Phytophthora pseudosyringae]
MQTLDRGEVKRRLVAVCRELTVLVRGSYGPLGRAQLLQANAQCVDALTATSVAERCFANLTVGDCPIANAYFHILKSKIRNHADAGLFLAGLSASLQIEIQEGSLAQIPQRVVSRGLQLALNWCLQYLEGPRCSVRVEVNWSSTTSISAVIRGIISSKSTTGLDEGVMDSVVIPLIVQAFVSVFGYVVEHPTETVPVQLLFASGEKAIAKSEVWKQTVLLDLPWPARGRVQGTKRSPLYPPICNVRIALFNVTIEPLGEFEEEGSNSGTSVNHSGSLGAFRLKALRQVGDRLERLGATAVFSQKIIPKYLQSYLAAKAIFTLDRLSATYIRGVQMLSGATILSDWRMDDSIISCSLGFLSLITTQTLGNKKFIRLHREDPAIKVPPTTDTGNAQPVTTIAIAAPDRFAYDELSHVVTTSLKTLAALIDEPYVVAGAGCVEIHIATLLRNRARQLRIPAPDMNETTSRSTKIDVQADRTLRQLSQTVTTFAECLENLAGRLCGSHATSTDRAAMIEQVRNANSESLLITSGQTGLSKQNKYGLYGWNPRTRSVMPVLSYALQEEEPGGDEEKVIADARILDVLQSKKDALVLAIESVSSLARISSVVRVP